MNKVSLSSPPYMCNSWSGRSNSICGCWLPSASLYFALPSAQTRCICKSHVCRRQTVCFLTFYLIRKTPQVPPVGLVSTRAGRQKKNAQHAGHLHNTSAWPSEFSPFRRPPVVIHAATIDWHRIGLLLAATSRNVHNGHLICIRISSLRITWRFDCF